MNAGVQTFPLRRRCGILALRPGALGKEMNNGTTILYLNFAFSSREHAMEDGGTEELVAATESRDSIEDGLIK